MLICLLMMVACVICGWVVLVWLFVSCWFGCDWVLFSVFCYAGFGGCFEIRC